MTCIVGVETDEGCWIGADSWADDGWHGTLREDPKLFESGPFVIGFTTSYRMGQLLRYRLEVPEPADGVDDEGLMAYMVREFAEAVRRTFRDGGFTEKEKDREMGGEFLVAVRGRLFAVEAAFQACRDQYRYDAKGSGYGVALGSLATTEGMGLEPRERVTRALEAAHRHAPGVRPPFHVHFQRRPAASGG